MFDAAWLPQGHGFRDLWDPAETGEPPEVDTDEPEDDWTDQEYPHVYDALPDPWTEGESDRWAMIPQPF